MFCLTDSSSSDEDSDQENDRVSQWMEELMAKKRHPERLHEELWFNEDGEVSIYSDEHIWYSSVCGTR